MGSGRNTYQQQQRGVRRPLPENALQISKLKLSRVHPADHDLDHLNPTLGVMRCCARAASYRYIPTGRHVRKSLVIHIMPGNYIVDRARHPNTFTDLSATETSRSSNEDLSYLSDLSLGDDTLSTPYRDCTKWSYATQSQRDHHSYSRSLSYIH